MSNEKILPLKLGPKQVLFIDEPLPLRVVIDKLAMRLEELGFVRNSFSTAVFEREQVFPTGLPTKPVGVAIPHTDAEHVISDAIAIGILSTPVLFEEMGTIGRTSLVEVSLITMLAISDPKGMVPLLSQLARCYQDGDFLLSIMKETQIENVIELFKLKVPQIEVY